MAQKRFGPTLDAGTVIIEKEAEQTIQASALGTTAYVGIMERGPVGELITTTGKRDLLRKTGSYIPDHYLPDCASDFWQHSEGAGSLLLYRVTAGNEKKALLNLYDRKAPRNLVGKVEAKDGGGWGGKRNTVVLDILSGTEITETEIELPVAYVVENDEWKGGTLTLLGADTVKAYEIIGNDQGTGSVTAAKVQIAADSLAKTDFGAGSDYTCVIDIDSLDGYGQDKYLAVEIRDGQVNPSTEWGFFGYLNGELVAEYPNISSNPNANNYWEKVINEDGSNHYFEVTDLWVGAATADTRPANHWGSIDSADIATDITEKTLDIGTTTILVSSVLAGGASTIGTFTFGSNVIADTYEIEYDLGGTAWLVSSTSKQEHHAFPNAATGVAYTADNSYSIGFTVVEATPADGDKFTLTVLPLEEDELINGRVYLPNETGTSATGWMVTDNTETTSTITTGDLTIGGTLSGDVEYRLQYQQQLQYGYDGTADVDVNDFLTAYEPNLSPFNETQDKGYGLIKFATPGVTSDLSSGDAQTVEETGVAYASAKNHQYRYEIAASTTDETVAKAYIQDTVGKSDYAKVCFPSWASVADPIKGGLLKVIPVTGMIHGRESLTAKIWDGFHKVAAGLEVTLPRIREIPTGDTVLNGEILNPAGLQRIIVKGGNYIVWGARIPYVNSEWKFCQHRELMSYYEHVLQESFDWVIFAINDKEEQPRLIAALKSFFLPEWRKRALRGDDFEDAAQIKIDDENNNDSTRLAGDLNCEIRLRLADTVERFIITISKMGVFSNVG